MNRGVLAQIEPGRFRTGRCRALVFSGRQFVGQRDLSAKRSCAYEQSERNKAKEHSAAEIILVRAHLQTLCHLKHG